MSRTRIRLFQFFQLAQLGLDVGGKRSGGITSRPLLAIGLAVLLVSFRGRLSGLCVVALLGGSLGGLSILFGGLLGGGGGLGLAFLLV